MGHCEAVSFILCVCVCVCMCEMNASLLKKKLGVRLLTNHLSETVSCIFVCVSEMNASLLKKFGGKVVY